MSRQPRVTVLPRQASSEAQATLQREWRRPNSKGFMGLRDGYVLSPFAGFGSFAFGEFQVLGPSSLAFQNSWTNDDWTSVNHKWKDHIAYWFHLSYEPLDNDILQQAVAKLEQLTTNAKAGDAASSALKMSLLSPIANLIKRGDANTSQFDNLGNASDATHRDRYAIFTSLNDAITKLANAKVPAFTPPADAVAQGITGATTPGGASSVYLFMAQQQQAAQAAAAAQAAVAKAKADAEAAAAAAAAKKGSTGGDMSKLAVPEEGPNKLLIFGGIGLVTLLGVGAVLMMKKKK